MNGSRDGFALVEVLVSLALAALIAVLLIETVRISGRTAAAVAAAETAGQIEAVRDHLQRTFGSLASRHMDGSLPVLQGSPDTVSAAIAPDRALERPVEVLASLSSAPRIDGAADLFEHRVPLEDLQGLAVNARSEVLLKRIAALSLRYYGAPAKGGQSAWLPTWN